MSQAPSSIPTNQAHTTLIRIPTTLLPRLRALIRTVFAFTHQAQVIANRTQTPYINETDLLPPAIVSRTQETQTDLSDIQDLVNLYEALQVTDE
jgi:hypothetical protein